MRRIKYSFGTALGIFLGILLLFQSYYIGFIAIPSSSFQVEDYQTFYSDQYPLIDAGNGDGGRVSIPLFVPEDRGNYTSLLTMYGPHRAKEALERLPKWTQDYFLWHRDQRMKENDEDSDVKYLVMTCLVGSPCCCLGAP